MMLCITVVVHSTFAAAGSITNQGFILTGPKRLEVGTSELFCVSVKDIMQSIADFKLDLFVEKSVTNDQSSIKW